jgi:UDP-glucose 4-epimerase
MRKKVLITGAGGYIGSVSAYLFLQNDYDVVAVDNFVTGYRQPLELLQEKFGKDRLVVHEQDLRENLSPLFEYAKDITAVVHYAASCLVDESVKHPEKYFSNNVGGSQNLLTTMMKHGVKHIVFSSTCAVYGNAQYVPLDEKHPTHPESPYGESKRMIETMMEWYSRLNDLKFVVLRYFNVCGASDDGLIGDSKKPSSLLMQNAVRGALGIDKFFLTCPTVNTPDGTPIRDYVNVVDLNEAHLAAIKYLSDGGKSEIINLGTGTGNSVLEIVNKVEEATGKTLEKEKTTPREGESDKMIASIQKASYVLHWQPKRSLEDSIKSLITWYNVHPQGWER